MANSERLPISHQPSAISPLPSALCHQTSAISHLPSVGGTYALVLHLARAKNLRIGKLGTFHFPRGDYVYVGSAFGAGGLRARIARHARKNKCAHWHIDYLREHARLCRIVFTTASRAMECEWSRALSEQTDAVIPVAKFGAMDCQHKCAAHLIAFPRGITSNQLCEILDDGVGQIANSG